MTCQTNLVGLQSQMFIPSFMVSSFLALEKKDKGMAAILVNRRQPFEQICLPYVYKYLQIFRRNLAEVDLGASGEKWKVYSCDLALNNLLKCIAEDLGEELHM